MSSGYINDILIIECDSLKSGKKLAFSDCKIFNTKKQLLYTGFHTKAFIGANWITEMENVDKQINLV